MEATFGLLELVDDAMTALRLVYRDVLASRVERATEQVGPLVSAVDRIRAVKSEGAPALYRFSGDPRSSLQVTPWLLPIEAIESLERVRSGEAEPSSLFADRDVASARPGIDPASVRERFHRDNRGVQVLTTYLAEGGATPRFYTVVNEMLREDRGVEPLITGLVNTSVILAHMTAGALGATAEGLVAGLLDVYSRVGDDQPPASGSETETGTGTERE